MNEKEVYNGRGILLHPGRCISFRHYKDGKANGPSLWFNAKGQKRECIYVDDSPHGTMTHTDPDGSVWTDTWDCGTY